MPVSADQLRHSDPEEKISLLKQLQSPCSSELIDCIAEIVRGRDEAELAREAAAFCLGRLRHPQARQELLQLATSEDAVLRELGTQGLEDDDDDQTITTLINALGDSVNKVRNVAERALLKRSSSLAKVGVQQLLNLLASPARLTRSPAARLLGQTHDPRALQPLLGQLDSEEWLDRMWGAHALGDLGHPDAIPHLKALATTDPKNRVRASAIEALGALRPGDFAEFLDQVLTNDVDPGVQKTAEDLKSSLNFGGEDIEYDPFAED